MFACFLNFSTPNSNMSISQLYKEKAVESLLSDRRTSATRGSLSRSVAQAKSEAMNQLRLSGIEIKQSLCTNQSLQATQSAEKLRSYSARQTRSSILRSKSNSNKIQSYVEQKAQNCREHKQITSEQKEALFQKLYGDFLLRKQD